MLCVVCCDADKATFLVLVVQDEGGNAYEGCS